MLDALLKLRQVCCDPTLVKTGAARSVTDSAKRDRLRELLAELVAEGRRVLVFSQFVEMLRLIEADLSAVGIASLSLTGETRDRAAVLDAFDRAAQIPVHLTTREFFATLQRRLAPDGVMLTNLHQGTRFFASQVLTIATVFPEVLLMPVEGGSNVVALAANTPVGTSIGSGLARMRSDELARYRDHGVDLAAIVQGTLHKPDYLPEIERHGVVLTDDFAPVESLDRQGILRIEPRRWSPAAP